MMKAATFLICCLLAVLALHVPRVAVAHAHPPGNVLLDWRKDPNIARVSAMNFDFHGSEYFVSWRAPGRVEKVEGREYLVGGYFPSESAWMALRALWQRDRPALDQSIDRAMARYRALIKEAS